uniref:Retrotransposon gag domain-containing protein n=1 Tax=Ananas comosus var. bracteatus TaxID=296719 RepID=A0A6V7NEU6_ANACO|nr:unnamed protein product [Ananas comosus var. bracteatus]
MQCLEDLLLQQAAAGEAQVSVLPAPVEIVAPGGSSPVLDTSQMTLTVALREKALTAPPAQVSVTTATFPLMVERVERQRLMDRLDEFRKRDPRIFDREKIDHWIIEKWLMHMEKLFRDTFVEERDRVGSPLTIWTARPIVEHYFLVRVKRKEEQDLREMRQEDRTVAEYERGFFQLLRYAPFVVRDDEDKARIFERGLRSSILRLVQPFHLQTYQDVVNRALIVESCAADLQERRKGANKGNGKRPVTEGASQTHSGRPSRHSGNWSQSRGRGSSTRHRGSERHQTRSCVICGGHRYPQQCSQRQGRCYSCGQEAYVLEAVPVELREDLSFEEQPVKIFACEVKKLRNRDIPYVKVLWSNHGEREATWELENALQERYPPLFQMEF